MTPVLLTNFGSGAQFFDLNGDPLSGGKLFSYDAGTTTPADTWTDHTAANLNSNPIILDAEGRVPEQIWIDVDKSYKFTLKDSTDVQIWTKDYNGFYTPPPYVPPATIPQLISVWDFFSPQQIADVKARTFTLDVSAEIQTAINYVISQATTKASLPIGTLFFPPGGYRVDSQINVTGPIFLQGAGQGGEWTTPATVLQWFGGAGNLIHFGRLDTGLPFYGGGISRMAFNCRELGQTCLFIYNCRAFEMADLYLTGATYSNIVLTNPNVQPFPSGIGMFRNIWINAYANFTNNSNRAANGITIISATPITGPSGCPACTWDSTFISHTDGSAILVNGGDNHHWTKTLGFRSGEVTVGSVTSPAGTGPGVYFQGTDPTNTQSAHMFLNAAFGGGVQVDSAGPENDAHFFLNFNDGDLSPGATSFSGVGAGRVNATTHSGRVFGSLKTHSYRDTIHHDMMSFVDWTATILRTTMGSWGTSAAAVTNASQVGGAVRYATTAVPGNIAAIYNCTALGVSGVQTVHNPHLLFSVSPIDALNVIHRFGFMDSIGDPASNGAWVEIDQAVSFGSYRLVCANAGVQTVIVSPLSTAGPVHVRQVRIEMTNQGVSFYGRLFGERFFTFLGTITTNVPLNKSLDVVFWTKTTNTLVQEVFVYDYKLGFLTEF